MGPKCVKESLFCEIHSSEINLMAKRLHYIYWIETEGIARIDVDSFCLTTFPSKWMHFPFHLIYGANIDAQSSTTPAISCCFQSKEHGKLYSK